MSLKKWVRIAIGILASSGIAAILSGGALAASNGQDTTPQNAQNVWLQQQGKGFTNSGLGQTAALSGEVSQQNQSTSTSTSSDSSQSVVNTGVVSNSDDGNGPTSPGQSVSQGNNTPTSTNGAQSTNSGTAKPSQKQTNFTGTSSFTSGSGGEGQFVNNDKSFIDNGDASGVEATGADSLLSVPEMAVVAPVDQTTDPGSKGMVRTTIMPIQPMITNRAAALEPDLAESMPAAPAPFRVPVPAKSTGVLAGLVVGLSNVVIPQSVTPIDAVSLKLMLGISLLTLVALLVNVFEFSYGQWLRKGGFATAARSDEPANGLTSLFATPLLSGYVEQPPRLHNPVLMVLVPNAYRKEDRR